MDEHIPSPEAWLGHADADAQRPGDPPRTIGHPSNEVYARVGDTVLRAAQEGVRSGMRPEDIIREIVSDHHIRLNLSEFRLLLASRRVPARVVQPETSADTTVAT